MYDHYELVFGPIYQQELETWMIIIWCLDLSIGRSSLNMSLSPAFEQEFETWMIIMN